jgi:hypothetical protein
MGSFMANATRGAIIDRHVPKNAGSTFRTFLRQNSKAGRCTYVGYDVSRTWKSRVGFNHHKMSELSHTLQREGGWWCVEAHVVGDNFWPDVAAMRAHSHVVMIVRVREPLAWYRSFYDWYVVGRQRGSDARFGDNFTDWLPANLQSRNLLLGTAGRTNPPEVVLAAKQSARAKRLDRAEWQALRRIVHDAELVAPMERFDETLVLLKRLVPFLATLSYRRKSPRATKGPWGKAAQRDVPGGHAACAGDRLAFCRDAVRAVAPDDHELYRVVAERFERRLQRVVARDRRGFEAALRAHRAAVAGLDKSRVSDTNLGF